ncbi:MAG: AAA family ATPase [Hyphomonadaceae bacterium]|nr:AAA family ATPase [Hyphomonadaceae bacterium]
MTVKYLLDTVFARKWSLVVYSEDFRGYGYNSLCIGDEGRRRNFPNSATLDEFVCDGVHFKKFGPVSFCYKISARSAKQIDALLRKLEYRNFENETPRDTIKVSKTVDNYIATVSLTRDEFSKDKLILASGVFEKIKLIADRAFDKHYNPEGFGRKATHILLKTTKRTGKSSVAYALAAEYNARLRFLSPDDFVVGLPQVPDEGVVFVVDEADEFFSGIATRKCGGEVALANFQFFADTILMQPKTLLIYTTNHPEKIDSKFLARCKHSTFEIGCFDKSQAKRYLALFKGFENDDHFIEGGTAQDYQEYVDETRSKNIV